MEILVLGLVVFVGAHAVPARPALRAALVGRLGAGGYRAAFGILSVLGFVLIVYGFGLARSEGVPVLYYPPAWTRHIAMLLMLFAFILLPATYLPGRLKATVKHPMITAVKTWALAHLLVNGDVASLFLFGTFLAWGVYDRISLKRRPASEPVRGSLRNDILAVVIGGALYAAFVWKLHLWLIGVPILA